MTIHVNQASIPRLFRLLLARERMTSRALAQSLPMATSRLHKLLEGHRVPTPAELENILTRLGEPDWTRCLALTLLRSRAGADASYRMQKGFGRLEALAAAYGHEERHRSLLNLHAVRQAAGDGRWLILERPLAFDTLEIRCDLGRTKALKRLHSAHVTGLVLQARGRPHFEQTWLGYDGQCLVQLAPDQRNRPALTMRFPDPSSDAARDLVKHFLRPRRRRLPRPDLVTVRRFDLCVDYLNQIRTIDFVAPRQRKHGIRKLLRVMHQAPNRMRHGVVLYDNRDKRGRGTRVEFRFRPRYVAPNGTRFTKALPFQQLALFPNPFAELEQYDLRLEGAMLPEVRDAIVRTQCLGASILRYPRVPPGDIPSILRRQASRAQPRRSRLVVDNDPLHPARLFEKQYRAAVLQLAANLGLEPSQLGA